MRPKRPKQEPTRFARIVYAAAPILLLISALATGANVLLQQHQRARMRRMAQSFASSSQPGANSQLARNAECVGTCANFDEEQRDLCHTCCRKLATRGVQAKFGEVLFQCSLSCAGATSDGPASRKACIETCFDKVVEKLPYATAN